MIFLVCAHTDPAMLARMCLALNPYRVLVHIDARKDVRPFVEALASQPHVAFLSERVPVKWAGFSQVEATLLLLKQALKDALPGQHLITLSGQDYPIQPVSKLALYLSANPGTQFIRCFNVMESESRYMNHVNRRHHRDLEVLNDSVLGGKRLRNASIRLADLFDRRRSPDKPEGLLVAHGETHWAITSECASDVLAHLQPAVMRYFKTAFAPDEKFFHSIVASSAWRDDESGQGLIPYQGVGNWRYTNFHLVNRDHSIRDTRDWPEVRGANKFFVRKVQTGISDDLLDKIDRELLGADFPPSA